MIEMEPPKSVNLPINSPWFTPKEAAQYCRISLSLFNQKRKEVPINCCGSVRRPRFHKEELDYWMRNRFKVETVLGEGNKLSKISQVTGKKNEYKPHFLH